MIKLNTNAGKSNKNFLHNADGAGIKKFSRRPEGRLFKPCWLRQTLPDHPTFLNDQMIQMVK
jgi:hypothetical protein